MKHPNWRCPSCGSINLSVNVSVWRRLEQDSEDDNFQTTDGSPCGGDEEWDSNSPMSCNDCDHSGNVLHFEVEEEDEPEKTEEENENGNN